MSWIDYVLIAHQTGIASSAQIDPSALAPCWGGGLVEAEQIGGWARAHLALSMLPTVRGAGALPGPLRRRDRKIVLARRGSNQLGD